MTEAKSLAAALAAFQADMPTIAKANTADAGNYKYRYADLSDVTEKVMPLLGKHGLSFTAKPTLTDDGRFVLRYRLQHVSGESDGGDYPLSGGNAHAIGSAITYARRYTLCAITGVAPGGDDDDGASAKDVQVDVQPRRQERAWDPNEQAMLFDAWKAEIEKAKSTSEIAAIGQSLLKQKREGELSPSTYQRLATLGGRRKAELDAAEQAARAAAGEANADAAKAPAANEGKQA